MFRERGRQARILEMNTNEIVQPVYNIQHDIDYNYDTNKMKAPIAKLTTIENKIDRFNSRGIFGDIYDERKEYRFGQPRLSSVDKDKAVVAIDKFLLPQS